MTFTFTIRISAFFVSAGVPNGDFPEILIAKCTCRSRFYCTLFFSRAEDFESLSIAYLLTLPLCAGVSRIGALSLAWTGSPVRETLISRTHLFLLHDLPPTFKIFRLSPINCQSVDNCCIIINTLINHHDPIYL
jgi:hypothetical protein